MGLIPMIPFIVIPKVNAFSRKCLFTLKKKDKNILRMH